MRNELRRAIVTNDNGKVTAARCAPDAWGRELIAKRLDHVRNPLKLADV